MDPYDAEKVPIIDKSEDAMRSRLRENGDGIGGTSSEDERCIYRVPQSLIGIHPTAIQPERVSIGPYHRGKNELLKFENYKWWFLNRLLSRTKRHDGPDILRDLIGAALEVEERTRRCYDEKILMSSQDFVEMMVLDGCFIIELFRHVRRNKDVRGTNDPILSMPCLIPILTRDLLKLENQLPFFVLQTLFSRSRDPHNEAEFLELLALNFFNISFRWPVVEVINRSSEFQDVKHLLDLFHSSFSPPLERTKPVTTICQFFRAEEGQRPFKILKHFFSRAILIFWAWVVSVLIFAPALILPTLLSIYLFLKRSSQPFTPDLEYRPSSESIQCTTKLRPSGVKFKPLRADSFLVINFKDGVLQIPAITINDLAITVYVNCIALEQCNYNYQNTRSYFTTYIAFMSCLINSSKDVAFLSADGIITSSFSHNDHDVAALFNKLGEKVSFHKKGCYLSQQFRDIEAYYNSPRANLLRTYFSRPWSFISFFSAFILLVLNAGQTALSILTYLHHKR